MAIVAQFATKRPHPSRAPAQAPLRGLGPLTPCRCGPCCLFDARHETFSCQADDAEVPLSAFLVSRTFGDAGIRQAVRLCVRNLAVKRDIFVTASVRGSESMFDNDLLRAY